MAPVLGSKCATSSRLAVMTAGGVTPALAGFSVRVWASTARKVSIALAAALFPAETSEALERLLVIEEENASLTGTIALAELLRVLKPGGIAAVTTISPRQVLPLHALSSHILNPAHNPSPAEMKKLFEDAGVIARHDFGAGRSRYETIPGEHHDHLIDLKTGKVIEFTNDEIEKLQKEIARKLGYRLVDHRLELYAMPLDGKE